MKFIKLTKKYDEKCIWIQIDKIESIEEDHGGEVTLIRNISNDNYIVKESPQEILQLIKEAEKG